MSDLFDYDDDDDSTNIKEYDITSTPNDFNIMTLHNLIENEIIKIPPFQRNYVWDEKRASKFIESILLGLPIPQIFLYEKEKNTFLVIDGQQRLLSIYFFIKQRFPTKEGRTILREYLSGEGKIKPSVLSDDAYFKNFSLQLPSNVPNEKNKYNGIKYETLDGYKNTFDHIRTIRTMLIKQNSPEDGDSSIYEIFNRLNTGGQNLKPQEIRMSLYYSDFYNELLNMNREERWREIINQENTHLHFQDVEILLRAFAMLVNNESYTGNVGRFLNQFSKDAQSFSVEKNAYLSELFKSFIKSLYGIKNKDFLNKNNKFNLLLFEAVFVAITENFYKNNNFVSGKINMDSFHSLKKDLEFSEASQSGTGSSKNVKIRLSRARELIKLE